jgi:hypothetical protein
VRDRRAGVSAYYRANNEGDEAQHKLLDSLRESIDDALLREDAARLPGVLAQRAGDRRLGRHRGRRHGAPLFARPHLGNAGAIAAAIAGNRRRAGHRLRRRHHRRTAGAARAFDRPAWTPANASSTPPPSDCAQVLHQRAGDPGRHAGAGSRRATLRPGLDAARTDLCRTSRPGRGRGRTRACAPAVDCSRSRWASTTIAPRSNRSTIATSAFTATNSTDLPRRETGRDQLQPISRERKAPHFEVISLLARKPH